MLPAVGAGLKSATISMGERAGRQAENTASCVAGGEARLGQWRCLRGSRRARPAVASQRQPRAARRVAGSARAAGKRCGREPGLAGRRTPPAPSQGGPREHGEKPSKMRRRQACRATFLSDVGFGRLSLERAKVKRHCVFPRVVSARLPAAGRSRRLFGRVRRTSRAEWPPSERASRQSSLRGGPRSYPGERLLLGRRDGCLAVSHRHGGVAAIGVAPMARGEFPR